MIGARAAFLLLAAVWQAAGCARTEQEVENLEKRWVEFKSGKVMRVFKF